MLTVTDAWNRPHPRPAIIEVVTRGEALPYHGLPSRGLLDRWRSPTSAPAQAWPRIAPLIEDAWNYWAERAEVRGPDRSIDHNRLEARVSHARLVLREAVGDDLEWAEPQLLRSMLDDALTVKLRSYDQGVRAAIAFLTSEAGNAAGHVGGEDSLRVGMQVLREGHTTTVMRLDMRSPADNQLTHACLNVARDLTAAATELETVHRHLEAAHAIDPDGVPAVVAHGPGAAPYFGELIEVPIVAVTWLEGMREVHVVPEARDGLRCRVVLVDEFRPHAAGSIAILGRSLDAAGGSGIWADVVTRLTHLAHIDWAQQSVCAFDVELNDGDVVAANVGAAWKTAFVAMSQEQPQLPLGVWPFAMALISTRNDTGGAPPRLYWSDPDRALAAVAAGLRKRQESEEHASLLWSASQKLSVDRIADLLAIDSADRPAMELVVRAHRLLAAGPPFPGFC